MLLTLLTAEKLSVIILHFWNLKTLKLKYYIRRKNHKTIICFYNKEFKIEQPFISHYDTLSKYCSNFPCQFISSYCGGLLFSDIL